MELQTEQPSRTLRKRKASILLVDDDINLAESVSAVLEGKGYEVLVCDNGADGLRQLRAGALPDLILLDLMMPELNGWQFRIEQRKCPEWAAIPVIAFSGDDSPQAAAIDAVAYLKKPVEACTLLSTVADVLDAVREEREEARRAELERVSSLGLLAAGIAHEINNPLALTFGNLELLRNQLRHLQDEVPGSSRGRVLTAMRQLEDAQHGAQRIADIVRSVAAYSRPTNDAVTLVDVVQILESSIELVDHELSHRARLVRDYRAKPKVLASPSKLTQAFLNLLTHAMHGAQQSASNQPEIRVSVLKSADGEALITVEDDGPGMSPVSLASLFEPFSLSDSRSVATGFGLAISHRIFSSMGAQLTAEAAESKGIRFRVRVRTVHDEASSMRDDNLPRIEPQPQRPEHDLAVVKPRLVVIDDEPLMCDMLAATLDDEYDVRTFTSARAALAAILAGEPFDVLVCDLMMPDFSGVDLYRELARVRSGLSERIIFMTGGAFTEQAEHFMSELGSEYLMKPFQPATASSLIQKRLRVLAATPGSQPN